MIVVPATLTLPEVGLPHLRWITRARGSATLAFLLASVLFGFVHAHQDVTHFLFDSRDYWEQASLQSAGSRGYLFPLLLAPARWVVWAMGDSTLVPFWIYASVIYAAVLTLVLPWLFTRLFGGTVSLVRRLIPCLLLATVFPGLLTFPVSDLPAFLLCCGAVVAVQQWRSGGGSGHGSGWQLLAAGMLAAGAYNTRSIYMFPLLALALAILVSGGGQSLRRRAGLLVLFLAGALLVTLPQVVINKQAHGSLSPSPTPGRDLFAFQLFLGLEVQRYETTDNPDGAKAGVPYIDRAGRRLMEKPGVEEEQRSIANYLEILRAYPLDLLGIYGRHLVNGLDVRDGKLYITRSSNTRDGLSLYGFCLLSLAAWILLAPSARGTRPGWHAPSPNRWLWAGVLLLPVAAITPGAVETRFFLPLHLLAYCTIAFRFDWRTLAADLRARGGRILVGFLVALSIFLAITLTTMTQ